MKSNYVKSLIISLGIAVLFTGLNSYARPFVDSSNVYVMGSWHEIGGNGSYSQMYYKGNNTSSIFANYNLNTGNTATNLFSYNAGDYTMYRDVCHSSYCPNVHSFSRKYANYSYSFIKLFRGCTLGECTYTFATWDDDNKRYLTTDLPSQGYIYDFDGVSVHFDNYFPWHGNITLMDSQYLHTVQLIGNKSLIDKVIFVDPVEEGQNVYFIDFFKHKAYSLHVDDPDELNTLFFAKFDDEEYFFNSYNDRIEYSYTILGTGNQGNYFHPQTAGQYQFSDYDYYYGTTFFSSETNYRGLAFTYQRDLITEKPDWYFPDSEHGSATNTGSTISSGEMRTYESCISEIQTIKNIASLEYACRNTIDDSPFSGFGENPNFTSDDFNALYEYLYNYNGTGTNPSTKNVSCTNWEIKTTSLYYGAWSGVYTQRFLTARDWSVDPNSYDPVNYCGDYPSSSSEQVWYCRVFNIGCSDDFAFGGVFNTLNLYIRPFMTETLGEYKRAFNSGYNYLGEANKCSSDFYGKSYEWGNFALLFVVAWIGFTLYSVFKD